MTKITWEKKGLIFSTNPDSEWMVSHGMLPTAELISTHITRIYFGARNNKNQSHIVYIDFDFNNLKAVQTPEKPLLSPGKLGTFDDNGVLPSSVIEINNRKHMYYIGFKPGGTTRMDLFGGLAFFKGQDALERYSEAPIIERCKVNPYINTAPFVIKSQSKKSSKYFMYYVAGCGWTHKDLPKYNIQIASSEDGIQWQRERTVCIDFKDDKEVALARPYVLYLDGRYHMWFSYKGDAYHIGYARSDDGINWTRLDDLGGLAPSGIEGDFDSDMAAYGCVVPYQDKLYMFYNGNNYGYDGIGLAIADA